MAAVDDLDIIADRARRIAKIVREAASAPSTHPEDPDIDIQASAAQRQAMRARIDPLVVDMRAAWARLPINI